MAEIKWIKLSTDVFNNRKIRQIECMPDGDTIIVIWFKILALAGEINDSGQVYLTKEIPYTEQLLATQFNRPIATVRLALQTFQQFGMIEIIDNLILVSNWEKYQNIEGMERVREQTRLRVARCRENKRLAECNATSNATSRYGNAGEEEKEEDKDKNTPPIIPPMGDNDNNNNNSFSFASASAREGGSTQENRTAAFWDLDTVARYFKDEYSVENPYDEAQKFMAWNQLKGKVDPKDWKKAADLWASRISDRKKDEEEIGGLWAI